MFFVSCKHLSIILQLIFKFHIIKHCQFCRCRRSRCSSVRNIICYCCICFMSYCRYNRGIAIKNSFCHNLFIKSPQILYRATTTAYNNGVKIHWVKTSYSVNNVFCCISPLHKAWIQIKLHIRITSGCYINNILYCRTCLCCTYSNSCSISWNRFLIHRIKKSHFFKFNF